MNEDTCIHCGQTAYKSVLAGPLCRAHYIRWLEIQLGPWVKFSENYQQAGGYTPLPYYFKKWS
jgi:hypothetical protein